jgi:hypothetical protein
LIDDDTYSWTLKAIDHIYPGKRKTNIPLWSTVVTDDRVGILVFHDQEQEHLAMGAGVLAGLAYSEALVREIGRMNTSENTVLGAYNLKEGQSGNWSIYYSIKFRFNWLEPTSRANAQLLIDSLSAVQQFAIKGRKALQPSHGGEVIEPSDAWWLVLVDNI